MNNQSNIKSKQKVPKQTILLRLFILILVITISVFIYMIRDKTEYLTIYGYPGIFIISLLAYATVLLPAPGILIIFILAGVLNPWITAIIAGTGAACGELIGYLGGYSLQVVLENQNFYRKVHHWMGKNAPITILLFSAIPNPFFDIAGLAAGVFKIPVFRFFLWCWLGELIKMLFFSLLGAYSFDTLSRFLK